MIAWEAFNYRGNVYDLSHLHPTSMEFVQPVKDNLPARSFRVEVCYSLHCFSKKLLNGADPKLHYSDARETRCFDFDRYELSKQLPSIIKDLHTKKCMHTGKGNFFIIEIIKPNGDKLDYEVYFDVQKADAAGSVHLYVQSAYVRDPTHSNRPPTTKKIALFVILANRLEGKIIKIPPR